MIKRAGNDLEELNAAAGRLKKYASAFAATVQEARRALIRSTAGFPGDN